MKYKAVIVSVFGNAEFEFEANNDEEMNNARKRFSPKARCPCRETVYIIGVDNDFFEQLW